MVGKSRVASSASSSTNRSKTPLSTSTGRASGRSILLMTTMGRRSAVERLAQHEARLRHDALGGIDEQQGAVGHFQDALDLAAEIGVAGRVDDVDLGVAELQGDVLGQDGDAALALQIVGVEDQPCCRLQLSSSARNRPDWRSI